MKTCTSSEPPFNSDFLEAIALNGVDLLYRLEQSQNFEGGKIDADKAQNRLTKWLQELSEQCPQTDFNNFPDLGYEKHEWRKVMAPLKWPSPLPLPSWVLMVNEIINFAQNQHVHTSPHHEPPYFQADAPIPFQEIFISMIDLAMTKIKERLGPLMDKLSLRARETLQRLLLSYLARSSCFALYKRFKIYRLDRDPNFFLDDWEHLQLDSRNPDQYYQEFIQTQKKDHLKKLFSDLPVLARCLGTSLITFIDHVSTFVQRLDQDFKNLQDFFGHAEEVLAQVVKINCSETTSLVESHPTIILQFNTGLRLVYKSRPITREKIWFKLLDWMNQEGAPVSFKSLRVLDRDDYGWVEYIETIKCSDLAQIQDYYTRSGALAALFSLMHATDCHAGNIVASKTYPVLIDLEMILQPVVAKDIAGVNKNCFENEEPSGPGRLSILSTGFLPATHSRTVADKLHAYPGICALSNRKKFRLESPSPFLHINKDCMSISRKKHKKATTDLKMQKDDYLLPNLHIEQVLDGFQKTLHFCLQKRSRLLHSKGPLFAFRSLPIRIVIRQPQTYNKLQRNLALDKYLAHSDDYTLFLIGFLHIASFRMFCPKEKLKENILRREVKAFEKFVQPYFTVISDQKHLMVENKTIVENFFQTSGYERMVSTLKNLSPYDIEQGAAFIKKSLKSYFR